MLFILICQLVKLIPLLSAPSVDAIIQLNQPISNDQERTCNQEECTNQKLKLEIRNSAWFKP
jgi:hypothetical protein